VCFAGIGDPLRLTYYNENHPYYIPEDAFDDFDESMNLIQKVWSMHNCESTLAHSHSLETESHTQRPMFSPTANMPNGITPTAV
jgi:hypothetical protein